MAGKYIESALKPRQEWRRRKKKVVNILKNIAHSHVVLLPSEISKKTTQKMIKRILVPCSDWA